MPGKPLGEQIFEGAAKGWRSLWGAENLPADKRIYMESVIDKRRDPITERSLKPDELEQLRGLIVSRYERIKPQLQQDVKELRQNAQEALREAATTRNPETKAWHLRRYRNITGMMNGIQSYLTTGKLNPAVVDYAKRDVPTNIQYEDYDNPLEVNSDVGAGSGSPGRQTAIGQTLGRFTYEVDPQGTIIVKDTYDFGSGVNALTGLKVQNTPVSIGDLITPKKAAVKYARARLPEGKGRPVTIRVNSMAPPKPKEKPNWFSKAAAYLGF